MRWGGDPRVLIIGRNFGADAGRLHQGLHFLDVKRKQAAPVQITQLGQRAGREDAQHAGSTTPYVHRDTPPLMADLGYPEFCRHTVGDEYWKIT